MDLVSEDVPVDLLPAWIDSNRRGDCFFYEARDGGLSLEAAADLERRKSEKNRFRLTIALSWIAATASVVGAIATWSRPLVSN